MIKGEFGRYDEYRDSGVEWLGEVPEHWEVKRLKDIAYVKTGGKDTIDNVEGGLYPFFVRSQTIERINSYSFDGEAILTAGDGVGVGKVFHYVNEKFDYHQRVYKISHFKGVVGKFIFYYMRENFHKDALRLNAKSTVDSLRMPMFHNFSVAFGNLEEQQEIVNYLDAKTVPIDRKIDLLTQKLTKYNHLKQSLINETVTRGLDKTVAMKDSGVEWIGEVPEHWGINKISQSFSQIGSGTTPKSGIDIYYEGGTINWINTGDLNDGILSSCKRTITAKALKDYSLNVYPAGSIIIAMYGATIGKVSISMIEGCTNQACCVLNKSKVIDIRFLFYWFISKKEFIISLSYGGGQPNISQDTIKSLRIICPSTLEQKSITDYLDTKTTQIDLIIQNINTQITKLKELRKTLINDVVIGKIKIVEEA